MCKEQAVDESKPMTTALRAVYHIQGKSYDTLDGFYQTKMVHTHTCKQYASNIYPHRSYGVVTLNEQVIAIALVTLQHAFTSVGDATALPAVMAGVVALLQGTQIVV